MNSRVYDEPGFARLNKEYGELFSFRGWLEPRSIFDSDTSLVVLATIKTVPKPRQNLQILDSGELKEGNDVVVKLGQKRHRFESERQALTVLNTEFERVSTARPERLYVAGKTRQWRGKSFLVKEFVTPDFQTFTRRSDQQLAPERLLFFLTVFLDEMARFHKLGIAHGDLHVPENLLIKRDFSALRTIDWDNSVKSGLFNPSLDYFQADIENVGGAAAILSGESGADFPSPGASNYPVELRELIVSILNARITQDNRLSLAREFATMAAGINF